MIKNSKVVVMYKNGRTKEGGISGWSGRRQNLFLRARIALLSSLLLPTLFSHDRFPRLRVRVFKTQHHRLSAQFVCRALTSTPCRYLARNGNGAAAGRSAWSRGAFEPAVSRRAAHRDGVHAFAYSEAPPDHQKAQVDTNRRHRAELFGNLHASDPRIQLSTQSGQQWRSPWVGSLALRHSIALMSRSKRSV